MKSIEKPISSRLLATSASRNWQYASADVNDVSEGTRVDLAAVPRFTLTFPLQSPPPASVTFKDGAKTRKYVREPAIAWIYPPGLRFDFLQVVGCNPGILRVVLDDALFERLEDEICADRSLRYHFNYEKGVADPLINQIGASIREELLYETSAGSLLVDTLASSLAVRVLQLHQNSSGREAYPSSLSGSLGRDRLARVLNYIEVHLEGAISLEALASVACLSRFHFARAFKAAVGKSPQHYVGERRLARAKILLTDGSKTIGEISKSLSFSSPATFSRAFRRSQGVSPLSYRQHKL